MAFFRRKKTAGLSGCPNCGMPVTADTVFCESCGLRLRAPPACSKCSLPLAPDTNFCESCGTPVGTTAGDKVPHSSGNAAAGVSPKKGNKKGRKKARGQRGSSEDPGPGAGLSGRGDDAEEKVPDNPEPGDDDASGKKTASFPVSPLLASKEPRSRRTAIPSWMRAAAACIIVCCVIGGLFLIISTLLPLSGTPATPDGTPSDPVNPATDSLAGTVNDTTDTLSLVPGPTRVVPDPLKIWVRAERDPVSHNVSVIFDGGKGQTAVRDIFVRLIRSDREVLTASFRPEVTGEGITLQGTEYTDRVEVTVRYNDGSEYRVIDKLFEHKVRS